MKAYIIYPFLMISLLAGLPAFAQDGDLEDEYGNSYNQTIRARDYGGDLNFFDSDDDPGSGEEGGGSVEDPEVPIDDHLLLLLLSAIGLGWCFYRSGLSGRSE